MIRSNVRVVVLGGERTGYAEFAAHRHKCDFALGKVVHRRLDGLVPVGSFAKDHLDGDFVKGASLDNMSICSSSQGQAQLFCIGQPKFPVFSADLTKRLSGFGVS